MSLAAILEKAGFVPVVPTSPRILGTPQSKAHSHVPTIPAVPKKNREGENETAIRARLVNLADVQLFDAGLVRTLPDDDIEACAGLSDATLVAYLQAIHDATMRKRGKRPPDENAAALCRHCGPTWTQPTVAAVAPVVNGWPRLLGCPWCHVRNRRAIPRPSVTCGACRHFIRDAVNPRAGWGCCSAGVDPDRPTPMAARECARFRPSG